MLYLDPTKEKLLTFEVEISGDACDEITSHVRLFVEGVELGFPGELKDNKIIAYIKPLRSLVKFPLRNGTVMEARLDVLSKDLDFYTPWTGEIEIKSSFTLEAKLVGEDKDKKNTGKFTVKTITEDEVPVETKKPTQAIVQEKKTKEIPVVTPSKQKVHKITESKPFEPPKKTVQKPLTEEDLRKKIDMDFIKKYMTKAGSKNPTIQEIILNNARVNAKSGDPIKILKEVMKILKKPEPTPIKRG
jgi:hypothetical protein